MANAGDVLIFLISHSYLLVFIFTCIQGVPSPEHDLHKDLQLNYSRSIRPVLNFSHPTRVLFGASLYQLVAFDAKQETMSLILWQRTQWTDEYLRWDPSKYSGIEKTRFGMTEVWIPDMLPFNDVGEYDPLKFKQVIPVSVTSSGYASWLTRATTTTTCSMDVSNFPFDKQLCHIALGSWQYSSKEVNIDCAEGGLDLDSYQEHSQWTITNTSCTRISDVFPSGQYTYLNITVSLRRLNSFYVRNIILPNTILLKLSTLTFFLPCELGERLGYGVTILLAVCVNLIVVMDYLPETSRTMPIVCHYFFFSILLCGLSLLLSTIMVNFHVKKRNRKVSEHHFQIVNLLKGVKRSKSVVNQKVGTDEGPNDQSESKESVSSEELFEGTESTAELVPQGKGNSYLWKVRHQAAFIDKVLGISYCAVTFGVTGCFLYFVTTTD